MLCVYENNAPFCKKIEKTSLKSHKVAKKCTVFLAKTNKTHMGAKTNKILVTKPDRTKHGNSIKVRCGF
jgi:hypothetical protein